MIALDSQVNEVRPSDARLNDGERKFVEALQDYWTKHRSEFGEAELYVLRNRSRGRGLAFLEAGNFYPDFILWLKRAERSNIVFVDPKGLRNLDGLADPKVQLAQTVKEREAKLGRSDVTLDSFIVSTTPYERVQWAPGAGLSAQDLEDAHVMFPADNMETMLGRMFARVGGRGEQAG